MTDNTAVIDFPKPQADVPQNARFCVLCRWCEKVSRSFECHAPQNRSFNIDPVTGESGSAWHFQFCSSHRKSPSTGPKDCGNEGLWFEPREVEAAE